MNKTIYIVLFLVICCSCTSKNVRLTDRHYITNTTGKRILHQIIWRNPCNQIDSGLTFYSNGQNINKELEWEVSCVVGKGPHTLSVFTYKRMFRIYNIDDTTSVVWENYWGLTGCYEEGTCPYFHFGDNRIGERITEYNDYEINHIGTYYFEACDSFLLLMQKDYSMLEKFKEYYE